MEVSQELTDKQGLIDIQLAVNYDTHEGISMHISQRTQKNTKINISAKACRRN